MSGHEEECYLPRDIEHYLAALCRLYEQDGERRKQEIIVNSQLRVHEKWTYDNWDGGTYGHAMYLVVPEGLYLSLIKERGTLQEEIKADINRIHNVQNEFIAQVFIEMEKVKDRDWRRESGVLHPQQRLIAPAVSKRIWGDSGYRVFLSHKSEVKKKAAKLKEALAAFGVSSFVAHTDIHPTREWQDEIKSALASMDAFVALLSEEFHESDWTDQEVGYALGRAVPLIAIKLGRDPYGFIGRFQALACDWHEAPVALVTLLIKQPAMLDAYINAVPQCVSFDQGNTLSEVLPAIETLTEQQAKVLLSAYNTNTQLQGSYGFSGTWTSKFGPGLAVHLTRATGGEYAMTSSGHIKVKRH